MSYILDALRRADAERERGTVPGIHAQPAFAAPAPHAARPAATRWVWVGVMLAAVALAAVAAWYAFGGRREAVLPADALARVASAPAAAAPTPAAASGPASASISAAASAAASAPAPAPAPVTASAKPEAQPPPPSRRSKAAAPEPSKPAARTAGTETAAARDQPPPARDANAGAAGGATPPARPVVAMRNLPEEIRRQLPPVKVGGSMYSPTPADRILIVNGQVLHEGDKVAPELTLQQIKLKAAVLEFKGYRYELMY